jgi:hypothetical protein
MLTPAGKECRYFYGDYHRGRTREECRLLKAASPPQPWQRALCAACPVPNILLANACENLLLSGQVKRPFPFLRQTVNVEGFCTKTQRAVTEPRIGCGECHPLPLIFSGETRDPHPVS